MSKKLTTEEFIEKAKSVHGDRYDYSKVEYNGLSKKVCVVCKEHGEFWQNANDHLRGHGCPACGKISTIVKNSGENNKRRLTKEEFIKRSREIHGDKYDYSKVDYQGMEVKVCIICPIHGEFWIKPGNHIYGKKTGCAKCTRKTWNTEIFIEEAKKVHGDRYDYSKVEFKSVRDKVCIISKMKDKDGNDIGEFWQLPLEHLNGRRYYKESDVYKGEIKEECWEIRTCPICGKEFKIRKKYEKITCSEECRLKYVEIHKEEIDRKRFESGRKTRAKWTDEFKKSIREKIRKTNLERYGVENYAELDSERKRCSEKMKKQKHE